MKTTTRKNSSTRICPQRSASPFGCAAWMCAHCSFGSSATSSLRVIPTATPFCLLSNGNVPSITPFNFAPSLFYFSDLIRHKFDPALLFVSYLLLTLLGNHMQRLYPHRHLPGLPPLIGSWWKELAYYSKRFCRAKPCMCA